MWLRDVVSKGKDPRKVKIVLVRHAATKIEEQFPISTWGLTSDGIRAAVRLGTLPILADAEVAYASSQTKAIETMLYVAKPNHIPMRTCEGLTEISSFTRHFFREPEYSLNYEGFFSGKLQRIADGESSTEALSRFGLALEAIVTVESSAKSICVVTHGAILAFFTAQHTGLPVMEVQQRIAMPDIAQFDWQTRTFDLFWGEGGRSKP